MNDTSSNINPLPNNSDNSSQQQPTIETPPCLSTELQHTISKVTDHPYIHYSTNIIGDNIYPSTSSVIHSHGKTNNNTDNMEIPRIDTHFVSTIYDWQQHSMNLSQHMYQRGLIEGIGSDVVVLVPAWQGKYHLHRLILDQNPYFQTLFQGGFLESTTNEITLHFDKHTFITADSFQFVLERLYGKICSPDINHTNVQPLLATCSFFQLNSMCELCVEFILQTLSDYNAIDYLLFADTHLLYGSDRICDAIFTFLCREAYSMDRRLLGGISPAWLRRIMNSDAFFVPSEYQRYQFMKSLIHQQYHHWSKGKQQSESPYVIIQLNQKESASSSLDHSEEDLTEEECDNSTAHDLFEDFCGTPSSSTETKINNKDNASGTKISWSTDIDLPPTLHHHHHHHHQHHQRQQQRQRQQHQQHQHQQKHQQYDYIGDDIQSVLVEYNEIISNCIYFMHMTFEQLNSIRKDINPFTGEAMVPDTILKDALWNQVQMRSRIETAKEHDKMLDMTTTIPPDTNRTQNQHTQYPIPTDDSISYTGETAKSYITANRQPRNKVHMKDQPTEYQTTNPQEPSKSISTASPTVDTTQYSQYPPFRFSVEFKDVANLKRNVRIYSKTVFYAGSNWNMYIQKTKSQRKEIPQLGVYLHRQSVSSEMNHHQRPHHLHHYQHHQQQNNDTSLSDPPMTSSAPHQESLTNRYQDILSDQASFSRFSDHRRVTKTWFKIFCPSRAPKHALTLFQSSPDDFSVLQSWGWRSTILCADEINNNNRSTSHHTSRTTNPNVSTMNRPTQRQDRTSTSSTEVPRISDTISPSSSSSLSSPSSSPPPLFSSSMTNLPNSISSYSPSSSPESISDRPSVCCSEMKISPTKRTLRFSVVMGHV
ncbi:uncharacterized protein BX664DRAFT_319412 [Halteromyces radiatus]|uniref:uncharacterized protein n=1 Tax=Halteromyces radiatus TaxID=101107 RepID=UPI0022206FD5|nr:uncharacterized protein BX664DRAFT_319412 [Halteromyces radiatus]KAI8098720.1 hypothetical protein BX664DRAFT_319412 [Halteromyces radiatus]